jgi:hypothetical protein
MSKEKVIIVGSSGHSKVVIDIFEKEKNIKLLDFLTLSEKSEKKHWGMR